MKQCRVCKEHKEETEFQLRSNGKRRNECDTCRKQYLKDRYKAKIGQNEYNPEAMVTCTVCKETKIATEFFKSKVHKHGVGTTCKDCNKKQTTAYYKKNKNTIKAKANSYYYANKKTIRVSRRAYHKLKMSTDPLFKVTRNLRNRLWYALYNKQWKKNTNFAKYIGLNDYDELKNYLENKFTEDMNWDNYGSYWEIDHIIPLDRASDENGLYELCHYSNLQPLPKQINRTKSNSMNMDVRVIPSNIASNFHIKHHYLHKKCPIEVAFGLFSNDTLVGVCTFSTPYSPGLRNMVCGPEYSDQVIELNRMVVLDIMPKNTESWFISRCLRSPDLHKNIVVSFADSAAGHTGTIYRASNFIYDGQTKPHKDIDIEGKHSSTAFKNKTIEDIKQKYPGVKYKDRSIKYRYLFFRGRNRRQLLDVYKKKKGIE